MCKLQSALELLVILRNQSSQYDCFMLHKIKLLFITSFLLLSPGFGIAADSQFVNVDSNCVGTACAQASPTANQTKNTLADFSPSPVQLLLAGIALIVVRTMAKKYLGGKAE